LPRKPLTLGFDTSAAHCAAALLSGDDLLCARVEPMHKGQAERLFPLLEELLGEAGATWKDLSAIGTGTGPGNFTGIRISVSAARGLALSLGIPAVGVSVLEAQAFGSAGVVASSLDARRGSLYVQVFGTAKPMPPVLCTADTLPPVPARAEPICIGFAAADIARRCGGSTAEPAFPLAVAIARLAASRQFSSASRPEPLYIRSADAAPPRNPAPRILPTQ